MKRKLAILIILGLALVLLPLITNAEIIASGECGASGDNVTWTLDDQGVLTISGTGKIRDCYSLVNDPVSSPWNRNWNHTITDVKSVIIQNGVTRIGNRAFQDCVNLTRVSIPESVSSIGENAFLNCAISDIYIDSIESYLKIQFEGDEFSRPNSLGSCNLYIGNSKATSITIPESVTNIGNMAFWHCTGLTSITIPKSVTTIDSSAFRECTGLTSVTIPNSVTSIGVFAFYGCTGLTSVAIPDSVTSIGQYAFSYCKGLTSITIPDGVTSIGNSVFSDCTGLTSATIPGSVTSIDSYAFRDCTGLTSIKISKGVKSIGSEAFYNCTGLTSINIPESVTSIGNQAFCNCSSLKSAIISEGVTSIGNQAFCLCISLESITIPDSVTSIGSDAFGNCTGLTSVMIPDSVTSIGSYAFGNCTGLTSVMIPDSVTSIGRSAFSGCSGLESVTIPESVTSIGDYAFKGCSSIIILIPDGAKINIGENAFDEQARVYAELDSDMAKKLSKAGYSFRIPETNYNLQYIYDNGTITGLAITYVDKDATDVTVNKKVTSIKAGAFDSCEDLTTIIIPEKLTSVGDGAFNGCTALKDVYYAGTDRSDITFGLDNKPLLNAEWHYGMDHKHSLTKHDKIEATEEVEGSEAYWECSICHKLFSDEKGENEIEKPIAIPKLEPTTPEGKIKAFVKRCYKLILGRDADEGGLNGWSESLVSKTATAAQIIDGFVRSDEFTNRNLSNEAKVDILYQTMLNRPADEGGKAGWTDALSKGYTLQNIIDGFCGSDEFTAICNGYGIEAGSVNAAAPTDTSTPRGKIEAFVSRCYQLILNRQADQGGLQGWSDALESGAGQACQIIDGFVRSEEYVNRNLSAGESVDILYKTMLNREADAGGRAGWVDALSQGYTLQHIINGFCGSAEFTAICNDYGITAGTLTVASALVRREAITPEGEEAAPVIVDEYRSEFINEEKIRAFVEHCYKAVFGREGDAEGVANYTKLILDGKKTPKKVAYEFIFSPEFQEKLPGNEEFIRILYRLYFDREPGAEELSGWIQMLENGTSLEEIVNGFAGSAEFKAIVNEMK